MEEIERVLREMRIPYRYATTNGVRVTSNAYNADKVVSNGGNTVLVECCVQEIVNSSLVTRVDHHFPGDPGYGLSPEKYWSASSIGQVIGILNRLGIAVNPTREQRYIAAADHCLRAAYDGKCPGIDPHSLVSMRISGKAKMLGENEDDFALQVRIAMRMLDRLKERSIVLGGESVIDLTDGVLVCIRCGSIRTVTSESLVDEFCSHHEWAHFSTVRKLKEASAISGLAVMISSKDRDTQAEKINIYSSDGRAVSYFLNFWRPDRDSEI